MGDVARVCCKSGRTGRPTGPPASRPANRMTSAGPEACGHPASTCVRLAAVWRTP